MAHVKAVYWDADFRETMPVQAIRVDLFTHVFCAFAEFDVATSSVVVPEYRQRPFKEFNQVLHDKKPSLKTLLSLGGGVGGEWQKLAVIAGKPDTRAVLIKSTIQMAREYKFDGLDLDYEFPESQKHMDDLAALLSEWRAAVNSEPVSPGRTRLLLTAAVIYHSDNYQKIPYPAQSISANLDWINIMSYEFETPMNSRDKTKAMAGLHNFGDSGINSWLNAGVPSQKMVLGVPFYGLAWLITDPANHGYDAPANGPSSALGSMAVYHSRIMEFINKEGATAVYNGEKVGNYCYKGNTWVSYDGVEALQAKVKYIKEKGLLGYFAWHVACEDKAFTLSTAAALAFGP